MVRSFLKTLLLSNYIAEQKIKEQHSFQNFKISDRFAKYEKKKQLQFGSKLQKKFNNETWIPQSFTNRFKNMLQTPIFLIQPILEIIIGELSHYYSKTRTDSL